MQQQVALNQESAGTWSFKSSDIKGWVVMLKGTQIDIVWFRSSMSKKQIRDFLVYEEGYNVQIELMQPS